MDDFLESIVMLGGLGVAVYFVWKYVQGKKAVTLDPSGPGTLQQQVPMPSAMPDVPTDPGDAVQRLSDAFGSNTYPGGAVTSRGFLDILASMNSGVPQLGPSDGYTGERPQFDVRTGQPL